MATPLILDAASARSARLGIGVSLQADLFERLNSSGDLLVGSLLGADELRLGSTTALTRSMGDAQIDGQLLITDNQNDDSFLLDLTQTGTNPGQARIFVGNRDPEGNVTANNGDFYLRDGSLATIYVFRGTDATNTGWRDLSAVSGAAFTLDWAWDTAIDATDPTAGNMKGDNATQASITNIYISNTTDGGKDVDVVLAGMSSGDIMIITEQADTSRFLIVELTGVPVDNTGWWTLPVSVDQNGSDLRNNRIQAVQILSFGGAGSSPGGVSGNVQFNEGGSFGGDTAFDWNTGSSLLTVNGLTIDSAGILDLNDKDLIDVKTVTYGDPVSQTTSGATLTIDFGAGQKHRITVASNITTVNFTDPPGAGNFTVEFVQDGTGNFDITGYTANVLWLGGTEPTFGDGPNTVRLVSFYYNGPTADDYIGEFNDDLYS